MKKVLYKGQEYSQEALAKMLKLSHTTIKKYAEEANGNDLEDVLKRKMKSYVYKNKTYKSIVKLSEATEINRRTLTKLIETNQDKTIDEIVSEYKSQQREYKFKGKTYSTREEIAKDFNVGVTTVSKYLKLAENDLEKAIQLYESEHTYSIIDGVRYYSKEQVANDLKISVSTLNKYIKQQGSLEEAVKKIKSKDTNSYIWRGKTYASLESVARDMGLPRVTLKRILENETNGDIDKAYNVYQERNSGKYKGYIINGKEYSSRKEALKELGISIGKYYAICNEFDNDFEKTVEAILQEMEEQKLKKQKAEKIKKQKEIDREKEKREFLYNGEKIFTISELSRKSGISETTLSRILKDLKKGNVDNIIQDYFDSKIVYNYDDKSFDSIKSLAEYTGINELKLGRYLRKYDRDAEKAIFMIKSRDLKMTKVDYKGKKISVEDAAIILGIKNNELVTYLKRGMKIEEIEDMLSNPQKSKNNNKTDIRSKKIMYDETKSLYQYCIENKINYSCIYYAITMGKTKEEAIENYYANGQRIPTKWIFEKYDVLLKHLLLNEGIDSRTIVSEMRNKLISLNEAIEGYIIRDEAKKSNNIPEWQTELYYILTSEHIEDEEKEQFKKEFLYLIMKLKVLIKQKKE